jgi:hypothetical protein
MLRNLVPCISFIDSAGIERNWLLIFDNAGKLLESFEIIPCSLIYEESESILRGYWPVGASGGIL